MGANFTVTVTKCLKKLAFSSSSLENCFVVFSKTTKTGFVFPFLYLAWVFCLVPNGGYIYLHILEINPCILERICLPFSPSLPSLIIPPHYSPEKKEKSHLKPSKQWVPEANWWRLWWDLKQKWWQEVSSHLCRFGAGGSYYYRGVWPLGESRLSSTSLGPSFVSPTKKYNLGAVETRGWRAWAPAGRNLIGTRCWWPEADRACASEKLKREGRHREQTWMESFKSTLRAVRFLSIEDEHKREEGL